MGRRVWEVLPWVAGLGLAVPVEAADWSGTWAARTVDRTYEIVSISPVKEKGGSVKEAGGWSVTIRRPKGSWLYASGMVGKLGGEIESAPYRVLSEAPDQLEIARQAEGGNGTRYRLTKQADGQLLLAIEGSGAEMLLDRARPGETVSSGWPSDEEIALVEHWPDNPEMTAMFGQDQAARNIRLGQSIDWTVVRPADEARRKRAEALIAAGALHSGADFYHAAFIFQHGEDASDFLKAHVLAVAAAARGYRSASWIAAASLDRYLQSKKKPQIFGTQYRIPPDAPATQEPYDRALVTDGLRAVAGVPSLAEQEKRRAAYDAHRPPAQAPIAKGAK
jgi:hypothetical protein